MYKGELVQLREYRPGDIEIAQKYMNDFSIKRFLAPGIPYPIPVWEEKKWVESQSAMGQRYNFAIEPLADPQYIGGCGINELDWKNQHCTIGIYIGNSDFLGKGYGTDANKVLVRFIFQELGFRKIKLHVYSFNERAIRSYEKSGFSKEAVLKEELYREGKYHDIIQMSIFKSDWEKGKREN